MPQATFQITIAKASEAELIQIEKFFSDLQVIMDDPAQTTGDVYDHLLAHLDSINPSVNRVLLGYRTLVENVCDPNVTHLAWKPDIWDGPIGDGP